MDDGIELTLGLSTNGKFGVDPVGANTKLKRSCSTLSIVDESGTGDGIARTWSMPVDAEEKEEARKRKEWQMFRRREAKRRMSEKVRSFGTESKKAMEVEEESLPKIVSQRSSGSSGLTDFESQMTPPHGMNKIGEARSPQSVESFSEPNEQRPEPVNREVKPARSTSAPNVMEKSLLAKMPCVSTKGNGPNGKRVDGFLYRYKKGEEVKILCVCHGSFLSPAEFVKHAGGGDVDYPLRHIVVNPAPSL